MPFYVNKLIPFIFPFINTKVLVMTMADLDQFHIKRSTNNVNHIYLFHSTQSSHVQYNKGAFDCYDTIFCVGPHHVNEIRKTEDVYSLTPKNLINVGYSWLEDLEKNYEKISREEKNDKVKILIAPSWGDGNILETCIDVILEELLLHQYEIMVRPHPEFIKREYKALLELKEKYCDNENFILDMKLKSSNNIFDSTILITDWSGIATEFAWGMYKPVIFINTTKKIHNEEYEKINIIPLEDRIRNLLGPVLNTEDCINISQKVQNVLFKNEENKDSLIKLRNENIFNWGQSSKVGASYIINYCKEN